MTRDRFRAIVLDRFNMSLGAGLGRLKGRAFRIGHLGDFNELMLIGTLGGVELGLAAAGVPFTPRRRGCGARALLSAAPRLRARRASAAGEFRRTLCQKCGDAFAEIRARIAVGDEVSRSRRHPPTPRGRQPRQRLLSPRAW